MAIAATRTPGPCTHSSGHGHAIHDGVARGPVVDSRMLRLGETEPQRGGGG